MGSIIHRSNEAQVEERVPKGEEERETRHYC